MDADNTAAKTNAAVKQMQIIDAEVVNQNSNEIAAATSVTIAEQIIKSMVAFGSRDANRCWVTMYDTTYGVHAMEVASNTIKPSPLRGI